MVVVGHIHRLAATDGHRPDVAIRFLAISPIGDAAPVRRPLRLSDVIICDEPRPAICNCESPDLAGTCSSGARTFHIFPRAKNLLAVRRPGGMVVMSDRRQPSDRTSGGFHQEDSAAIALGMKCDPFAIRGEGRLSVILKTVPGQIASVTTAHLLQVDVPVARRVAGIYH